LACPRSQLGAVWSLVGRAAPSGALSPARTGAAADDAENRGRAERRSPLLVAQPADGEPHRSIAGLLAVHTRQVSPSYTVGYQASSRSRAVRNCAVGAL
jgi:hypothetical protein